MKNRCNPDPKKQARKLNFRKKNLRIVLGTKLDFNFHLKCAKKDIRYLCKIQNVLPRTS